MTTYAGPYRSLGNGRGPEKEPVFCKDCQHLKKLNTKPLREWPCTAPQNMHPIWYGMEPDRWPWTINEKNDCPWFEPKASPAIPQPPPNRKETL